MGKVGTFFKNNWGYVLAASALTFAAYHIFKKPKPDDKKQADEPKSGFSGVQTESSLVHFTITNNTNQEQKFTLFKAFSNFNNPNVGIIATNASINFFNNTLLNEPKLVKAIEIISNSPNAQSQVTRVITKRCKDASGNADSVPYIPMVSTAQFQGNMTVVTPENLILDGICYLEYTINPNTIVTMNMIYDTII